MQLPVLHFALFSRVITARGSQRQFFMLGGVGCLRNTLGVLRALTPCVSAFVVFAPYHSVRLKLFRQRFLAGLVRPRMFNLEHRIAAIVTKGPNFRDEIFPVFEVDAGDPPLVVLDPALVLDRAKTGDIEVLAALDLESVTHSLLLAVATFTLCC